MSTQPAQSPSPSGVADDQPAWPETVPERGLQIQSTATADGAIHIRLAEVAVAPPRSGQVVVRIEAAPINPSDLMILLGSANPADAEFDDTGTYPSIRIPLPSQARGAVLNRVDVALPVGQEGAGVVVAAGDDAAHLMGRRVAVMSPTAGTFSEYLTVAANDCLAVPGNTDPARYAAMFVNPLTALAMAETVSLDGHRGLIHTAAASSLGQMLVKICSHDGIPLVNVVRREEQAATLRALGAQHVCNSSLPSFADDLAAAVAATGATVAFDAIGGGTIAGDLLRAMESAAISRMKRPSPYGSFEPKHVHIYGHLDPAPIIVHGTGNGLFWGVSGWMMPQTLSRLSPQRVAELRQRIIDELDTTFKTTFAHTISLTQALTADAMHGYCRQATGQKYLITP